MVYPKSIYSACAAIICAWLAFAACTHLYLNKSRIFSQKSKFFRQDACDKQCTCTGSPCPVLSMRAFRDWCYPRSFETINSVLRGNRLIWITKRLIFCKTTGATAQPFVLCVNTYIPCIYILSLARIGPAVRPKAKIEKISDILQYLITKKIRKFRDPVRSGPYQRYKHW